MTNVIETLGDLVAILVAVGLSTYGFKLLRTFRGGIMEGPFRILAPAPLIFAAGEGFDVLDNLGTITDPDGIFHLSLEVLFMLTLLAALYKLSKVWAVKPKTTVS